MKLNFDNLPTSPISEPVTDRGIEPSGGTTQGHRLSMNVREILINEVLATLHIDLGEDLVSVIDLYMYGITQPFCFHEREEDLQVLSLSRKISDSLKPCSPDKECKEEGNALKMLVGRTLIGFDICDENCAEAGYLNPCEIMTNQGSIFLVPDIFVKWWLNLDNKCIDLPARYGFNHRIEDARMIIRPKGPYLQLLVSRCDHEGSRKCSNWDCWGDVQDDNVSLTDSLGRELLKSWDDSQENTMVFIPQNRQSQVVEDWSTAIPENLVLTENVNDTREMSITESQCRSPSSRILGKSFKCISDNWSEHRLGPLFSIDGSYSSRNIPSRDVTPDPFEGDLNIDLQNVWNPYIKGRTRESHTASITSKTYILELGARSAPTFKC